jgi:hypothetical protein
MLAIVLDGTYNNKNQGFTRLSINYKLFIYLLLFIHCDTRPSKYLIFIIIMYHLELTLESYE